MKKATILGIILIGIMFATSVVYYPSLPDDFVSNWDIEGQPRGSSDKFIGTFLLPIMSIFIFGIFLAIPRIDPLKKNIESFRKYYDGFILIFLLFFLYVHAIILSWNLGFRFNIAYMFSPSLAILFYYIGIVLEHAKRNWFIGIRTPWTLSSEKVWNKTHKKGAKLFKVVAIFAALGIFFPDMAILLSIIPAVAAALYLVVYSYLEYNRK